MDAKSLIYRCHEDQLTREETFRHLCSEMELPPLCNDQIVQGFKELDEASAISTKFYWCHSKLLTEIYSMFDKIWGTICTWPDVLSKFTQFLNVRYALTLSQVNGRSVLSILDIYHGKVKQIQVTGIEPEILRKCTLYIVDANYIILHANCFEVLNVYLMRLDLLNLKCTLLDSFGLFVICANFVFDYRNRRNFCILYYSEDEFGYWSTYCRIENSKLVRDPPVKIVHTAEQLYCERLDGYQLQTFEDHYTKFGEYNLSPGNCNGAFQKLFDLNEKALVPERIRHVWRNNSCYIFDKYPEYSKFKFRVFDLDTRRVRQVKLGFFQVDLYFDLYVEENENSLMLCARNEQEKKYYVRRCALRKPDKLSNLALFKLRKDAIFCGSTTYKQVVAILPQILRPFPMCKSVQK